MNHSFAVNPWVIPRGGQSIPAWSERWRPAVLRTALMLRASRPGVAEVPEDYWDLHEATGVVMTGQPKVQTILEWVTSGLVLDLGCNDGGIADQIRQQGARVIGADRLRYVEIARQDYGLPVVAVDAARPLPFSDGIFDAVVISGLLEYLAQPVELLHQARRVLAPAGRLVLVAPNQNSLARRSGRLRGRPRTPEERFRLSELRALLVRTGFSIRDFRPCPCRQDRNWRARIANRVEHLFPRFLATDFAFLCEINPAYERSPAGS